MTFYIIIQVLSLASFIAYIISSLRLIKAQKESIELKVKIIDTYRKLVKAQDEKIAALEEQNTLLKEAINELYTRTDRTAFECKIKPYH